MRNLILLIKCVRGILFIMTSYPASPHYNNPHYTAGITLEVGLVSGVLPVCIFAPCVSWRLASDQSQLMTNNDSNTVCYSVFNRAQPPSVHYTIMLQIIMMIIIMSDVRHNPTSCRAHHQPLIFTRILVLFGF